MCQRQITGRTTQTNRVYTIFSDHLVLKNAAASDGLKVLSMYVKSFGYGTSTVVETKGATDTFAVTCEVKMLNRVGFSDIILQCDPEPSLIKWAESVKFQTSRANSHLKFIPDDHIRATEQRKTIKKRSCRDMCAQCCDSISRPHAIQTDH